MKSLDGYEQQFWSKVAEYGIADQVIVTGYIADEAELYTLFEEVGSFLFLFPEGLTARRSSVIHTLQSDRPVVVTAPRSMAEFAHHAGFTRLIEAGVLSFIPEGADLRAIADQLLAVAKQGKRPAPAIDWDTWWRATTAATHAAMMDKMATNNREEAAALALPLSASGPNSAQPHTTGSIAGKDKERDPGLRCVGALRPGAAVLAICRATPRHVAGRPRAARSGGRYDRGKSLPRADLWSPSSIFRDPDVPRALAGIDWNLDAQTQLLAQFDFGEALRSLEGRHSQRANFLLFERLLRSGRCRGALLHDQALQAAHDRRGRLRTIHGRCAFRHRGRQGGRQPVFVPADLLMSPTKIRGWKTSASRSSAN